MSITCVKSFQLTVTNPCTYDVGVTWTPSSEDFAKEVSRQTYLGNPESTGETLTSVSLNPPYPATVYWTGFYFSLAGVGKLIINGFNSLADPVNAKINCGYAPDLVEVSGPDAISIDFRATILNSLTTVSFPSIADVANGTQSYFQFDVPASISGVTPTWRYFGNQPNLSTVFFGDWVPHYSIGIRNANLSADSVNYILSRFAYSVAHGLAGAVVYVYLDGGTSSPPTGQGIIDKAYLILNGRNVVTN